jgi:NADH dehydrogenase
MAGQIAEIARDTRRDFKVADMTKVRVLLIEAGDRVLAGFPPSLSKRAERSLESLGVTSMIGNLVTDLDTEGVEVESGEHKQRIAAKTIIWAAGVLAAEIAGELAAAAGAPTDKVGRIVVEPDLTVPGHPEAIAIGDMVKVRSEEPYPGVAPVAMQMGRYAARLVRARLRNERAGDFVYHNKGNLATIGRLRAVAELPPGLRLSGFPAWAMWLAVHLWYLVGFQNRLLVFLRWSISFVTHGRGARLITGEDQLP